MKKAFHNFKLYILGIALAIFGIGLPLGIYGITMIPSLNVDPFQYPFLMVALAFLYALIGFAVSDIQIARWRRKNAEYDTKLPQEVKDSLDLGFGNANSLKDFVKKYTDQYSMDDSSLGGPKL